MNLRVSNLSFKKKLKIFATNSANPFNNNIMDTTTDAMLALVPNENRIEGTLNLVPGNPLMDDIRVSLVTDRSGKNVIVSTATQNQVIIPLYQNIAIEWDGRQTAVSGY